MDKYLWIEIKGMYFDHDTVKREPTTYESSTTFWAMRSGAATPRQAKLMVTKALPKFEVFNVASQKQGFKRIKDLGGIRKTWEVEIMPVERMSPPRAFH